MVVSWKPADITDREIRHWMKSKGWEVTGAEYDFTRKIYTWSARSLRSGHLPSLRISQRILEDFPAFAVLEHLDRLNVVDAIRRRPDTQYVLAQNGGTVALEEAPS